MAGGKETPRQKMIGMMYLVLTALLALNVQKEILDAFVLVDDGLMTTKLNFEDKNNDLYAQFETSKSNDPGRFGAPYQKALDAQLMADEIVQYIHDLKVELIMETEGLTREVADTISLELVDAKDNFDTPTNILIGSSDDGKGGKAHELRNRLQDFKDQMMGMLDEKQKASINLGMEFKGAVVDGVDENWEMHNFYHMQLAPDIVLLSKLQVDVRNIEYDVVSALMGESIKSKYAFDTVVARVVAPSNYVLLGDEYKAEVFVTAYSSTQDPEIMLGKVDSTTGQLLGSGESIPVAGGIGNYQVATDREGLFTYEGVINMKDRDGNINLFPFKSEYMVARPSATISPTKMNVLYKGVQNPLSVSVPGIADDRVKVSMSGGTLSRKGNGEYEVKLANSTSGTVDIRVSATMDDGSSKPMGSMTFRIKNPPKPEVYAAPMNLTGDCSAKTSEIEISDKLISSYGSNVLFKFPKAEIKSFVIDIQRNGQPMQAKKVNGNKVPSEYRDIMKRLRKGDVVTYRSIKAKDVAGNNLTLSPIVIRVK